jgi:hypothetical protein
MDIVIEPLSPETLRELCSAEERDREEHALTDEDLEPLRNYIKGEYLPGDFLQAVLRNDLREAAARADLYNRRRLFEYVQWLYNEAPSTCWGSAEKVFQWIRGNDA